MQKILVVDDEPAIRELLKERLEKEGFAVKTAAEGKEALAVNSRFAADLILLDIAMPGDDGYVVCIKFRELPLSKTTPILFLTGKDLAPEGICDRCNELGAQGFIQKAGSLKDLLSKIKEALK